MVSMVKRAVLAATMVLAAWASAHAADEARQDGIRWTEELASAFQQACREKKPLVVYFHPHPAPGKDYKTENPWPAKLEEEVLRTERFNNLAGRAVFAWVDAEKDDQHHNVTNMLKQLGVDRVPAVVVLDAAPDKIVERGRVVGYFPLEKYMDRVLPLLDAAPKSAEAETAEPKPAPPAEVASPPA